MNDSHGQDFLEAELDVFECQFQFCPGETREQVIFDKTLRFLKGSVRRKHVIHIASETRQYIHFLRVEKRWLRMERGDGSKRHLHQFRHGEPSQLRSLLHSRRL
jgi:hypothetical protein